MVPRSKLNGDVNQQLLKPSIVETWTILKIQILFVSQLYYCMHRITLFGEKTWELFMISYLLATVGLSLFLIWVKTFAGRNLGNPLWNIWWFWMLSPFFLLEKIIKPPSLQSFSLLQPGFKTKRPNKKRPKTRGYGPFYKTPIAPGAQENHIASLRVHALRQGAFFISIWKSTPPQQKKQTALSNWLITSRQAHDIIPDVYPFWGWYGLIRQLKIVELVGDFKPSEKY